MKERSNNKDIITKTRDFFQGTTEKVQNSKIIYGEIKRNNKK